MPNHVIRDRIWVSKKLAQCTLRAALAYPWIYLVCDDWGRFEYEPEMIRNQVFPRRVDVNVQDIKDWLLEYELNGLLVRYHVGKGLAYWTNFYRGGKRRKSQFPDPETFKGLTEMEFPDEDESGRTLHSPTERNETQRNETERARALIDAYNRILGCSIGYTDGNEAAAKRGLAYGYTVERAVRVFEAIQAKSTQTAKWCAENNHGFEYLTRPMYKQNKTQVLTLGPIEKIENELGSKKAEFTTTGGSGEAARLTQAFAEKAARKANG